MKVLFINNDGAGFADTIEIAEGITVAQLFAERLPSSRPADYLIRVNRLPATADQAFPGPLPRWKEASTVSGRMNWDRVNRENRAWREATRAPSGSWEPYDPPEVDWWPRAEAKPRRPKTEDKHPTVPWGMGISRAARQRRRRRERAEIQRRQVRVR